MRTRILAAVACAALAVSGAAFAQGRPGGAGAGMGAGPPITPPGQMGGGMSTSDYARGTIASSQGQFGRDFAEQQRANALLMVQEYRERADERKAAALATAAAARSGAALTAEDAKRIRNALKADMQAWRDSFQISRRDWQAERDRWLVDLASLTPQQWAQHRANWFAARDAWLAQQVQWAQSRRP